RQVLNNLIDNAIKFTKPGGKITVSLQKQDHRAVLKVKDTGVGMSAEDLPHVFDRFFRCNKSRTHNMETRGTGLGLSICQAVVQAHYGEISVTSTEGVGTCFTCQFPLDAEPMEEKSTEPGHSPGEPNPVKAISASP